MNDTAAKLRELSRLHPPQRRTVAGARYGATGSVVGTSVRSVRKGLDYQRRYYRDHKDAILATQKKTRATAKAQAARELKARPR